MPKKFTTESNCHHSTYSQLKARYIWILIAWVIELLYPIVTEIISFPPLRWESISARKTCSGVGGNIWFRWSRAPFSFLIDPISMTFSVQYPTGHFDPFLCDSRSRRVTTSELQRYSSSLLQGFKDEDLGNSPGRWTATVATYCPSTPGELPKFLLTKPHAWREA